MGLDRKGVKFLLSARRKDVSFKKTALIWRQRLVSEAKDIFKIMIEAGESITPVNNHPGYGFYQFSPVLFFRRGKG